MTTLDKNCPANCFQVGQKLETLFIPIKTVQACWTIFIGAGKETSKLLTQLVGWHKSLLLAVIDFEEARS